MQMAPDETLRPRISRDKAEDILGRVSSRHSRVAADGWSAYERDGTFFIQGLVPYPVEECILEQGHTVVVELPSGMPGTGEGGNADLYYSTLDGGNHQDDEDEGLAPITNPQEWEETLSGATPVFEFQSIAVSRYAAYRFLVIGKRRLEDAIEAAAESDGENLPGLLAEDDDQFAVDFGNSRIEEGSMGVVEHPAGGPVWRAAIVLARLAAEPEHWAYWACGGGGAAVIFSRGRGQ